MSDKTPMDHADEAASTVGLIGWVMLVVGVFSDGEAADTLAVAAILLWLALRVLLAFAWAVSKR